MFNNIFGKNKQEKLEIQQNWSSFFCRIEDKPASIRLNLALKPLAPIKDYGQQICFSVKFMNPDESGFTTREEFEMINAIEDTIIENISSKHNIVFAGAVKTDGRLDLYIYTQSIKGIDNIINSTMQTKFGDYQYVFDIKEDEEWKNYHSFLYPNPFEFQGIKNREVTFQLEQNGDNPEVKRMVDHWIDFKDKSNLKSFIDSAVAKGFEVLSEQQNDHEEFKYSLNIAKENITVLSEVNDYVWELMELAKDNNGVYGGWGCPVVN